MKEHKMSKMDIENFKTRLKWLSPNYYRVYPYEIETLDDLRLFFMLTIHANFDWSPSMFDSYLDDNSNEEFSELDLEEFINLIQLLGELNGLSNCFYNWQDLHAGR